MAKNIEEFLKLAAAKRQQAGNQPAPPPEPEYEPPPQRLVNRDVVEIVDEVQVVDPHRTQSVGVHVSNYLDTSDISEHAENLGENVGRARQRSDARIHQKFDHQVGKLDSESDSIHDVGEVSAARTVTYDDHGTSKRAAEIAELFRTPKSIRQAILLREIFDRPEWD